MFYTTQWNLYSRPKDRRRTQRQTNKKACPPLGRYPAITKPSHLRSHRHRLAVSLASLDRLARLLDLAQDRRVLHLGLGDDDGCLLLERNLEAYEAWACSAESKFMDQHRGTHPRAF